MSPIYLLRILASALSGFPIFSQNGDELMELPESLDSLPRSITIRIKLHYSVYYHALKAIQSSFLIISGLKQFLSADPSIANVDVNSILNLNVIVETLTRLSSRLFGERHVNNIVAKLEEIYEEKMESIDRKHLHWPVTSPGTVITIYRELSRLLRESFRPSSISKVHLPPSLIVDILSLTAYQLPFSISHFTQSQKTELLSTHLQCYDDLGKIELEDELIRSLVESFMKFHLSKREHIDRRTNKRKKRMRLPQDQGNTDVDEDMAQNVIGDEKSGSLTFRFLTPIYQSHQQAFDPTQSLDCLFLFGCAIPQNSEKRLNSDLYEFIRQQLFTLRCNLLFGISQILENNNPQIQKGISTKILFILLEMVSISSSVKSLVWYLSTDFFLAVKDGLTVRNFHV